MALSSTSAPLESGLVALVVSPCSDDLLSLRGTLPSNWTLYVASDAAEAKQILRQTSFPVILCEREPARRKLERSVGSGSRDSEPSAADCNLSIGG